MNRNLKLEQAKDKFKAKEHFHLDLCTSVDLTISRKKVSKELSSLAIAEYKDLYIKLIIHINEYINLIEKYSNFKNLSEFRLYYKIAQYHLKTAIDKKEIIRREITVCQMYSIISTKR